MVGTAPTLPTIPSKHAHTGPVQAGYGHGRDSPNTAHNRLYGHPKYVAHPGCTLANMWGLYQHNPCPTPCPYIFPADAHTDPRWVCPLVALTDPYQPVPPWYWTRSVLPVPAMYHLPIHCPSQISAGPIH